MNETERKVKMGDINTEGKKLKGQTEKSTKKESHTTDDDINLEGIATTIKGEHLVKRWQYKKEK